MVFLMHLINDETDVDTHPALSVHTHLPVRSDGFCYILFLGIFMDFPFYS